MKQFRSFVFLFIGLLIGLQSCGQKHDRYYSSIRWQNGERLKSQLHEIIKNHIEFPYTSKETDTWDILKEADRDPSNPENVILFYSGWSVNANQEYNNRTGWDREHVWAKSHGKFSTKIGIGTDLHNLKPTDISINAARGNQDFDYGGDIYIDSDGTTTCRLDKDSWEPRDEVKGDVARILFYMAVRFEGENDEPDLELIDEVNTFNLNLPGFGFQGKLSTLLLWHKNDPVDEFEIRRNNVIYSYQNNRNPFIDHPKFVNRIWGK
jgi:endonuclease I